MSEKIKIRLLCQKAAVQSFNGIVVNTHTEFILLFKMYFCPCEQKCSVRVDVHAPVSLTPVTESDGATTGLT